MALSIKTLYLELEKLGYTDSLITEYKKVCVSKNKCCRKKTIHIAKINDKIIKTLNDLPKNFVIQIGDTFYRKGGMNFVYDYFNQSKDYKEDLDDILKNKGVYIMLKGGCV